MPGATLEQPRLAFRKHLEAVLFAGAATAVLFSSTWAKALFFRDLLRWSYPGICFFQQSLWAGEIPLWSPYLFLGYPFLAEAANAVLYPLGLLHLLFAAPTALKVYPAIHYFLTGYLMWRLLREWGLSHSASLFGALTWMASGYLVSMHLNFNYLIPAAWYPGLLFAFHRLLVTRRLWWLLATALGWSLFLIGGDPQALLLAGVFLFSYAILAWQPHTPVLRQSLPILALAGALALLLIPAQLLPSLEFGAASVKLQGYDWTEASSWSFHPWRLLEFLWPGLWGPIFPPDQFWGRFLRLLSVTPWAGTVYLGLFPLLLAFSQFRFWRQPPGRFLVFTCLLFFLLALGYYSPLYRLVWTLFPPYRIFRYPEKHLVLAVFALAALAGLGLQRLLQPDAEPFRRAMLRAWLGLTALLVAAFLVWFFLQESIARTLADHLRQVCNLSVEPGLIRASLHQAFFRAPLVALAFLIVFWLSRRLQPVRRQLGPILIVLTAGDLLSFGGSQFIVTDPYLYRFQPAASRLIRGLQAGVEERFRVYRASKIPNPTDLAEPMGLSYEEKLVFWNRDTLQSNLTLPEGLEDIFGYDPAEMARIRRFSLKPLPIASFQMLNVKYLLDGLDFAEIPELPELSLAAEDGERNLAVLLNHGYFPRAYFVDGMVVAWDDHQFLDLLASTDFRKNVILLGPDVEPHPGQTFVPARIQSYRNREVVVEIHNPVAGYLVLSDTYFPGWEAEVDGKPTRILRANYLVRAVALEPGEHQVIFTYRPWPWRIGREASLVSLLLIPLLLLMRKARPVF